jgi:hypothetical protein
VVRGGSNEPPGPYHVKEIEMRRFQVIAVGLLLALVARAETQTDTKAVGRIDPLPRDLEIQLAPSALPPHLRDKATVYVLNPAKSFEGACKGTNGFPRARRSHWR